MKTKFNPKNYLGKNRIYRAVPGTTGITRLWVWNSEKLEYYAPEKGKIFDSRRWEAKIDGNKHRVKQYFETLEEARAWQAHLKSGSEKLGNTLNKTIQNALQNTTTEESNQSQQNLGPTFFELVSEFRQRCYSARARGTCFEYDKLLRLHFEMIMPLHINEITPKVIDTWLWDRKCKTRESIHAKSRKSFEKELDLLALILRYYDKYNDDQQFRFPIKQRHRDDMWVIRKEGKKDRDLNRSDFELVRANIREQSGDIWWALFTLQWCEALRISEAAALYWEDVHLNWRDPENSFIRICRHVEFTKAKNIPSIITPGFKNSKSTGGIKELPLFPDSFAALKALHYVGAKGLVFKSPSNTFFEYRHIQFRYLKAFQAAGIEYSGTHTLRHGGCRAIYNETGDLALAGQVLGNEDSDTVKVYARRDKSALKKYAAGCWNKSNQLALVANGRNLENP